MSQVSGLGDSFVWHRDIQASNTLTMQTNQQFRQFTVVYVAYKTWRYFANVLYLDSDA